LSCLAGIEGHCSCGAYFIEGAALYQNQSTVVLK
jgi:hypothetical protein